MTRLPIWGYLLILCGLLVANIHIYQALTAPPVLQITVLEAGKGRVALVRTPFGATILVDTGPDASILRALGATLPPWQRTIDAIILTSTKPAFTGGLPAIESRYAVTRSFSSGSRFAADGVSIDIYTAGVFEISHGKASLRISSTTPKGTYVSEGNVLQKENAGAP